MTSLHRQTSLQNRQCHALCMLGKTSKCRLGLATYMSFGAYTHSSFLFQNEEIFIELDE